MEIQIFTKPIPLSNLLPLQEAWYHELVKGACDIEKKIIALGGEWHMDANMALIEQGSEQKNIWGFSVYPLLSGTDAITYNSLINIRPAQGNRSRDIQNSAVVEQVRAVVSNLIPQLKI